MLSKIRIICAITYIITITVALFTLLIPAPSGAHPIMFHGNVISSILMALPHIGAVIIFILGLRGFSPHFKKAYKTLAVGFIFMAISFLQTPFLSWFQLIDSPWVRYGGVGLPFLVAILLIYIGIRGFALLFGVKSILTSLPAGIIAANVIGVAVMFIPHGQSVMPEAQVKATIMSEVMLLGISVWSMILAKRVGNQAGQLYVPAMTWLYRYMVTTNITTFLFVAAFFIKPTPNIAIDSGAILSIFFIATFSLVRSAFEFNKISTPETTHATDQAQDLPTIVIYTAGLASSTMAIDPILDEMRFLTSGHDAGAPLSDSDQVVLAEVYLRLEQYLAEQDPVRKFTKDELRQRLQSLFSTALERNQTFWRRITG